MKANILTFSKIIDTTHGAREHYHVPKYQREYTWGKRDWEVLVQDIEDNDPGYFMGAIIVVRDSDADIHGSQTIYEVVDGQQRLTTLSLFMLALYERMSQLRESTVFEDEEERCDFENCLASLRNKLVLKVKVEDDLTEPHQRGWLEKNKNCYLRVHPSTQKYNLADYRHALGQVGLVASTKPPPHFGNRRISHGLNYFRSEMPGDINSAMSLWAKINQLQFVFISVGSQADAFTLFETLNNRGVPLSAMDIVKNKMLAEMQKQHQVSVDESFEQWQQIVDNIDETDEQERFLRQFYNANHWDEAIRIPGIARATKAKIITIYEKAITKNPRMLFDQMCESAEYYGSLISPEDYELETDIQDALVDLQLINASPSYQLLLYLFTRSEAVFKEEDFLLRAINLIRKFYVRRNVTDFPGTSALDQAHVDTIAACQRQIEKTGSLTHQFLQDQVLAKDRYSSLASFREALAGHLYYENVGMTRYLLIKLDEQFAHREYAPDLWARNKKDKFVWTIEHVLPQTEKLSANWVKDLADGDVNKAIELHDEYVDRIGNLTLSGYNSKLATASFAKKQALSGDKRVAGQQVAIGYKNRLALNSLQFECHGVSTSLADTNTWNADLIQARTERMADLLIEMFAFDGERQD
ncbi:hypothetical protein V7x_10510 [Crateriforma conspicua]|uniref:DUF262 domain-containing protein n=1 Tax=Crateriforma conspicua TaxID=2527996 RepID=A0A5C6FT92_9PLAN|nr:DUF262 domain-containing protein [Crateriforma conspicua]TWU65504.1 hypothetical protein V7x_10510 [Crateriforma conspicua]